MDGIIGVMAQSLIFGIMVLGVYISYKILDFPDMSADGSFALGGAIIAVSLKAGLSPILGSILALIGGLLAGLLTGILHVKVKISNLLAGILVMGILYSVNLRIMGKANIPLFNENHIFKTDIPPVLIALILLIVCKLALDLFLKTGLGYTLKAVGDNPQMVKSLGIEIGKIKILGLMLSNGLIAFSGCIMAQFSGFADAGMGIGTLILGIASIIVGSAFIHRVFLKETAAILIGAIIYQFAIYWALNMGMATTDLKMISAFIVIIFLGMKYSNVRGWLNVKN